MPRARLRLTVPEDVWVGECSRAHPEATIRVLAALTDQDDGVGLVEVVADDPSAVRTTMAATDAITELEVLEAREDRELVQFETDRPVLLLPAQDSGVPLELPFSIREGEAVWEVTAPQARLSELGRQLDAFGIRYEVEWVQQDLPEEQLLTDRQAELLRTAVERGYYDTPRRTSLTDLAEAVGVAKSTCSETLHRAESKVVKRFLQSASPGEADFDSATP